MVLIVAGNDALSTVKSENADLSPDEYVIVKDGGKPIKGFIRHISTAAQDRGQGRP
jgi:hypothetical protein